MPHHNENLFMYPNVYLTLHVSKRSKRCRCIQYVGILFCRHHYISLQTIVLMDIIITMHHTLEQIVRLLCQMLCTACRPSAAADRNTQYHERVSQQMPSLIGFTFCVWWLGESARSLLIPAWSVTRTASSTTEPQPAYGREQQCP